MIDADDLAVFQQALRHANERHTGMALDAALVEIGWRDALAIDPRAAISTQFELQGLGGTTSSALDQVVASALGCAVPCPVLLPDLGTWHAPGRAGDQLLIAGLGTAVLEQGDDVLVGWDAPGGTFVGPVPTRGLAVEPVGGLDPRLRLVRVRGEVPPPPGAVPVDWNLAVARARIAIGHELTGAGRAMLALATEHALERMQFDRPIAGFQAVRHRLAEALVAIEMSDAALDAAWIDATPQTAAMAKSVAGRSARTVAKHCQQVLAGIGFTTEHPFHGFLRRVLVLDGLFGAGRTLTSALGSEVLEQGELPPLLAL